MNLSYTLFIVLKFSWTNVLGAYVKAGVEYLAKLKAPLKFLEMAYIGNLNNFGIFYLIPIKNAKSNK